MVCRDPPGASLHSPDLVWTLPSIYFQGDRVGTQAFELMEQLLRPRPALGSLPFKANSPVPGVCPPLSVPRPAQSILFFPL